MDEIEIDRELLIQTFVAEAHEVLEQMEQQIVALETNPDDGETLHSIFRGAHTLKGSSALVSFDAVRDLSHDLEDLLGKMRSKAIAVDRQVITLLLRSVDVMRQAVEAAAGGQTGPSQSVIDLRAHLSAAKGALPEIQAQQRSAAASSAGQLALPSIMPMDPSVEPPADPTPAPWTAQTLRVDLDRLDRMLNLAGEIAIARGRLTDMLERRTVPPEELLAAHRDADRLHFDLQELIMKARMVPIGPVFYQHRRTIRDLATACGKQVRLVIEGAEAEVDTAIIEHVRDPVTHMVRNAIDHGIELPEVRQRQGKDPTGELRLCAFHDAGSIVIEIQDDGAGLDRARILEEGVRHGLLADAARATDEDVERLIFEPGLSTSGQVTEISGRGVGMDVVRRNVEALRGSITLATARGMGTTVTIRLPLTLAIIQGLVVKAAQETYVFPLDSVVECVELRADERGRRAATGILDLRGHPLPYLRLRELFRLPGQPPKRENVVVVRQGSTTAGIAVDTLHGDSQTVIKPLAKVFRGLPGISGSSIMGDGRVALILDVAGLLRETLRRVDVPAA
jgi:two-component system chemotaxis sensor kinase CheA